ncbi:MAG: protein kinase [Paramuribaculum sp.]|nr:protein kinase [Paramuribaculum sp.]
MKKESRLFSDDEPHSGDSDRYITGLQTLSVSRTGFFRILIGKHHGRKIVVKALKGDAVSNPVAITQLKKEFDVMFPLDSPNIAKAFSLVRIENNIPGIEIEWCDGSDLRSLMDSGLSAIDIEEIILGVLRGLIDIHSAAIVHRDIKPENVIYDPHRKVVKIIDFGCAYATGALYLQGPGGTPLYTPDDKKEAPAEPVPADDLYALGVMCRELAAAIPLQSGRQRRIKRRVLRLADRLVDKAFPTASAALSYFTDNMSRKPLWPYLLVATLALIGIGGAILTRTLRPTVARDSIATAPAAPTADSTAAITPVTPPTQEVPKPHPSAQGENRAAESDAELFEKALYAGPLLRAAALPDAQPHILKDAFVIEYYYCPLNHNNVSPTS